ncbi:hypothetical protein NT6N_20200 [Oceaniferula spumae]|uniref:Glycosyl hydrolase n=1 Tax=Oceaniferula spumae TaxID=2979115 RepID=A0AAT9FLX9_9BACT
MRTLILLSLTTVLQASPLSLTDNQPASNWERDTFPIGNGTIGATVYGGTTKAQIQFTVDSLWTGNENVSGNYDILPSKPGGDHFGAHQSMGEISFTHAFGNHTQVSNPTNNLPFTPAEGVQSSHDNNPKTKWCFEPKGKEIIWQVTTSKPTNVTEYTLTSAGDVPARFPSAWKLEASNNGKDWTTIDKKINQAPAANVLTPYSFGIDQDEKLFFTHYRFTFIPRQNISHFQLGEIALKGINLSSTGSDADNYSRTLDLTTATHATTFTHGGTTYTRRAITSFPDKILAWEITADKPGKISGTLDLVGTHSGLENVTTRNNTITLEGNLQNNLNYAAQTTIIPTGGKLTTSGNTLKIENADSALILLSADTNYTMDVSKNWRHGKALDHTTPRLKAASNKTFKTLHDAHVSDHQSFFNRVTIDLGTTPPELAKQPTRERIENYRKNAQKLPRPCLDPDLEETLFQYGRYLLIAASRPGTLPANLQGVWNSSNKPAWCADYHTNINLQMNYWLAESTNLSELATPLFDLLTASTSVYAKHTKLKYGADKPGYVTRMSVNPFGGGGWNWNIEGTAWLSQHYWTHYLYTQDKKFLADKAYPFLSDVSRFWLTQLKELPDGTLVVPNAWSHEHGPHEDGTAHAQQLMHDLFTNTVNAAKILNKDADLVETLTERLNKLAGPKIGSWGQLMEWMEEKPDLEKSNHRHTSHLYAVHPGNQITLTGTPKLAEAARVSLEKRGEVGDSRRSWTWAWRTALWARLGQPERAHSCVAGLLAYNTLPNLWTTHPPFQIDGNYGISNGIAEMLVQSHAGNISLLPALTKQWPTGSVTGLKASGGHTIDIRWKDGKLTSATIKKGPAKLNPILINGQPMSSNDSRVKIIN